MNIKNKVSEAERWLKRSLKRKVSITESTVIAFLIAGFFGMSIVTNATYLAVNDYYADRDTHRDKEGGSYHKGTIGQAGGYGRNGEYNRYGNTMLGNPDNVDGAFSSVLVGVGGARVSGGGATSVGYGAKSTEQGTAIGNNTTANAQSTAVGSDVYAIGKSSISIGNDDITGGGLRDMLPDVTIRKIYKDSDGRALGGGMTWDKFTEKYMNDNKVYSPTFSRGDGSIAIGSRSVAYAKGSTTLGTLSFALAENSTAIGLRTYADFDAKGATAIGEESRVFAPNTLAIGNHSEATNRGSMAFGAGAKAVGLGSVAIGENVLSNARLTDSNFRHFKTLLEQANFTSGNPIVAKDNEIIKSAHGSSLNGYDQHGSTQGGYVRDRINNILLGKGDEDANNDFSFNVAEENNVIITTTTDVKKTMKSGDYAVSLGYYVLNSGDNSVGIGTGVGVFGNNAIALGALAYVAQKANNSLAIGVGANVKKENSVAIGTATSVLEGGSVGLGIGAVVEKSNSVAIGYGVNNKSAASIGIGNGVELSNPSAPNKNAFQIGIGNNSKVTVARGIAIGDSSEVTTLPNSVALGYNSIVDYTTDELTKPGYTARGSYSIPSSVRVGVLSVGRQGSERRIINVASGYRDSDAVTVSQLKTIEDKIDGLGETKDSTTRYFSVNQENGEMLVLASLGGRELDYKNFVKFLTQRLTVKARKADGESINESEPSLVEMDNKLTELRNNAAINDKATHLKALLSQVYNNGDLSNIDRDFNKNSGKYWETVDGRQVFKIGDFLRDLEIAKKADEEAQRTNPNLLYTAEELNKLAASNFSNKGAKGSDSMAIGYKAETTTVAANSLAAGTEAKVSAENGVALGTKATVEGSRGIAIGAFNLTGTVITKAVGQTSVAIGSGAQALGNDSIALGRNTKAQTASIAIGGTANAEGEYTTVIGFGSSNSGKADQTANNKGNATWSVIIGNNSSANSTTTSNISDVVVVGNNAKAQNTNTIAIGNRSQASGENSIAIGKSVKSEGKNSVVIGHDAGTHNNSTHKPTSAVIIGNGARVGNDNSVIDGGVAVGKAAKTFNVNGVALGTGAEVSKDDSVALGSNSRNTATLTSPGYDPTTKTTYAGPDKANSTWTPNIGEVAVGNGTTNTRRITGVAAGQNDTDAVNVAQLRRVAGGSSNLKYAANGNDTVFAGTTGYKTISLSDKGLNFKNTDNISVTVEDNGVVKHTLNSTLKGITSIENGRTNGTGGAKITLGSNDKNVNFNSGRLTNVAEGTGNNDAVNKAQLDRELAKKANATDLAGKANSNLNNVTNDVVTGKVTKGNLTADSEIVLTGTNTGRLVNAGDLKIGLSQDVKNKLADIANKANASNVYDKGTVDTKLGEKVSTTEFNKSITSTDLDITNGENVLRGANNVTISLKKADKDKLASIDTKAAAGDVDALKENTLTFKDGTAGAGYTRKNSEDGTVTIKEGDIDQTHSGSNLKVKLDNGTFTIGMLKSPTFTDVTLDKIKNANGNEIALNGADGIELKSGTGTVKVKDGKISGLTGTPTANDDAATKAYVDQQIGGNNSIKYKANDSQDSKSVALATGFNFKNDANENIIASVGENGEVTHTLSSNLTAIDTIAKDDNAKITLGTNRVDIKAGTDTLSLSNGVLSGVKVLGKDGTNNIDFSTDSKALIKVNGKGATFEESGNALKLTGLADGTIGANSTDAITGKQLNSSLDAINTVLGSTYNNDGTISKPTFTNVNGATPTSYKDALDKLATSVNGGMKFQGNDAQDVSRNLGDTLKIVGAGANANDVTVAENNIKVTKNGADKLEIGLSKDLTGITSIKNNDKHKLTFGTADTDSTVLTAGGNALTFKKANTGVSITGLEARNLNDNKDNYGIGDNLSRAATEGALKALADTLGVTPNDGAAGNTGATGDTGPAGKDGANGASISTKVEVLRDGTAGNIVYTKNDGTRLQKAKDGKFYAADDVTRDGYRIVTHNGTKYAELGNGKYKEVDPQTNEIVKGAVEKTDAEVQGIETAAAPTEVRNEEIVLSAVNPDGEVTTPTTLGNIASGIDPTKIGKAAINETNAKDAVNTLLGKSDAKDLNKVATVGDIQALAMAGFDVEATLGKDGTTTDNVSHRKLGNKFSIVGKDGVTSFDDYSADNLTTKVDKDSGKVTIGMLKTPTFDGVKLGSGTDKVSLSSTDGTTLTLAKDGTTDTVKLTGVGEGKIGADSKDAVTGKQLNDLVGKLGVAVAADGKSFTAPTFDDLKLKNVNGTDANAPTDIVGALKETVNKVNEGISFRANKNPNNADYTKQQLGSKLDIVKAENKITDNTTDYVGDNLITKYTNADGNGKFEIALKEKPEFKEVTVKADNDNYTTIGATGTDILTKDGNNVIKTSTNKDGLTISKADTVGNLANATEKANYGLGGLEVKNGNNVSKLNNDEISITDGTDTTKLTKDKVSVSAGANGATTEITNSSVALKDGTNKTYASLTGNSTDGGKLELKGTDGNTSTITLDGKEKKATIGDITVDGTNKDIIGVDKIAKGNNGTDPSLTFEDNKATLNNGGKSKVELEEDGVKLTNDGKTLTIAKDGTQGADGVKVSGATEVGKDNNNNIRFNSDNSVIKVGGSDLTLTKDNDKVKITGLADLTDQSSGDTAVNKKYVDAAIAGNNSIFYKATGTDGTTTIGAQKNTPLKTGLNFRSTTNITTAVADNGEVSHTLNNSLTGIESIKKGDDKATLTLGENTAKLESAKDSSNIDLKENSATISAGKDKASVEVGADSISFKPAAGKTITITNDGKISGLTDGTIGAASNEAITGKQVYELKEAGLKFAGNDDNVVTVKLGEQLNIKGKGNLGVDTPTADNNIVVTKSATNGELLIGLAEDIVGVNKITTKAGDQNAEFSTTGLVANGPNGAKTAVTSAEVEINNNTNKSKLTPDGLEIGAKDLANSEIKNVLNKSSITLTDTTGGAAAKNDTNTITASSSTISNKDGDTATITADKISVANGTDKVEITKNSVMGATTVGKDNDNVITFGSGNGDDVSTTIKVGGKDLTFAKAGENIKVSNVADGEISNNSKDAVNGSQLNSLKTHLGLELNNANTGFTAATFAKLKDPATGNDVADAAPTTLKAAIDKNIEALNRGIKYGADVYGTDSGEEANKKTQYLGSTVDIKAGDTDTGFVGKNLKTKYTYTNGNGKFEIGLTETPEFKSVSIKNGNNEVAKLEGSDTEGGKLTLKDANNGDSIILNGKDKTAKVGDVTVDGANKAITGVDKIAKGTADTDPSLTFEANKATLNNGGKSKVELAEDGVKLTNDGKTLTIAKDTTQGVDGVKVSGATNIGNDAHNNIKFGSGQTPGTKTTLTVGGKELILTSVAEPNGQNTFKDVVKISNVATPEDSYDAANKKYVDDSLRDANNKMNDVDANRPFVFMLDENNGQGAVEVVKGQDGKLYKKSDLENATYDVISGEYKQVQGGAKVNPLDETQASKVTIAARSVDPDNKALSIGNVAAALATGDETTKYATPAEKEAAIAEAKKLVAGTNGTGGLVNNTNATDLNKVVTLKDLQAVAISGLEFAGNVGTTHRTLGTVLNIVGKEGLDNFTGYSTENVATNVTDGKVSIGIKERPEFKGIDIKDTAKAGETISIDPDGMTVKGKDGNSDIEIKAGTDTTPATVALKGTDGTSDSVALKAADGTNGGSIAVGNKDNKETIKLDGGNGTDSPTLTVKDKDGDKTSVEITGAKDGELGKVSLKDSTGAKDLATLSAGNGTDGPSLTLKDKSGDNDSISLKGSDGTNGAVVAVNGKDGKDGVTITGTNGTDGSSIGVGNKDGKETIKLDGGNGTTAPELTIKDKSGTNNSISLKGTDGTNAAGLTIKDSTGQNDSVVINGADGTNGAIIKLQDKDGNETIKIDGGKGAITGITDLDENADGTSVTNKNYVDEKIADANAGQPFEYYTTAVDPQTGKSEKVKVVRGRDGKLYKKSELDKYKFVPNPNGEGGTYVAKNPQNTGTLTEENPENVIITAMPTEKPMSIGNVAAALATGDETTKYATPAEKEAAINKAKELVAGTNGADGLINKTTDLDKVVTLKDLQAVAISGLEFAGSKGSTHRTLGTTINIVGLEAKNGNYEESTFKLKEEANATEFTTKNIATKVEEGKVTIGISEKPEFKEVALKDGAVANKETVLSPSAITMTDTTTPNAATKSELTANNLTFGPKDPNAQDADKTSTTISKDGMTVKGKDGNSDIEIKAGTDSEAPKVALKDKDGTKDTVVLKGGDDQNGGSVAVGNKAGAETIKLDGGNGTDSPTLTVKDKDGTNDSVTIKGADGTNGPSINFAKNGADGTGKITGLADIAANETDGSVAANKNYVDSKIKEATAGQPFEYAAKDDKSKVVRGLDDKLYKEEELKNYYYDEKTSTYKPRDPNATGKPTELANTDVVVNLMPLGENKAPIALGNIESILGADAVNSSTTAAAKVKDLIDNKDKLFENNKNKVATATDVLTLAKAGIDFTGNTGADIHRNLGEKVTIKGEGTDDKADFTSASGNIQVASDKDSATLTVKLSDKLKNMTSFETNEIDVTKDNPNGIKSKTTLDKNGVRTLSKNLVNPDKSEYILTESDEKGFTITKSDNADGKTDPKASANYGLNGSTIKDEVGNTYITSPTETKIKDKDGNVNKTTSTDIVLGKDGKDGVVTPAVTITSGSPEDAATGKPATGPSIDFAKDEAGNGTGKVTGLGEITENDTRDTAVNKGYVDDRVQQLGNAIQNNTTAIQELKESTTKGIAGAMAQAGVKFQEIGVNQASVGAAVSSYKGTQAVAVGVQGAPTENVRVHGIISATPGKAGGANTGVTVGASWKFNLK